MLVSPREIVERRRFGPSRARDLARLRARFVAQAGDRGSRYASELAMSIAEAKLRLTEAFSGVSSCASCARGCSAPKGRWPGGRCCGTETLTVFSPAEVRALILAGARAPREAAGRAEDAGCAFRGPHGCTLPSESRPVRCLVYVCQELHREIEASPARDAIRDARGSLADLFDRFCEATG